MTEAEMERLARENPDRLLALLGSDELRWSDLTFAAEHAGRVADHAAARAALLPLLSHYSSLVREGTVYGLTMVMDDSVRTRLSEVAENDPSPGVRQAAREAIGE